MIVASTIGQNAIDLEAIETLLHSAVRHLGCSMLEQALNALTHQDAYASEVCQHGHHARSIGYRPKKILTVLGPVVIRRAYYYDGLCG